MKCLLVVVFATACGGAVPVPTAPIVEYPRGTRALESSAPCRVARMEHAIDYDITCASMYRR